MAERSLGQKTGCPFVKGLDGDDCFQAKDPVVDQQQAQSPTSVFLLKYTCYLLSEMKGGKPAPALDTPFLSSTE